MDSTDPLREFAKANSDLIECEDTFITQHVMANDFELTPRMLEFMMPMLKMRSKIEDLKQDFGLLVDEVRDPLFVMDTLVRDTDDSAPWKTIAVRQEIRGTHGHIEGLFKVFASTKLRMLKIYKRKVLRMVARVQREKNSYTTTEENSLKIMDPELGLDIIEKFISCGQQTACVAWSVNIQYSELLNCFLDTTLTFCENVQKLVAQSTVNEKTATGAKDCEIQTATTGIQTEDVSVISTPELNHGPLELDSDQDQVKLPAKKQRRKWINYLCIAAVLYVPCASYLIPIK